MTVGNKDSHEEILPMMQHCTFYGVFRGGGGGGGGTKREREREVGEGAQ